MSDTKMKTLLLQMKNGKERKLTINAEWIVTFGPVAIGSRSSHDTSSHVLRVWGDKGKTQLKAIFRDVTGFMEEGIQLLEKEVRTKRKTFKRQERNGEQSYQAEVRATRWRDPFSDEDDEGSEFDLNEDALQLPSAMGDEGEEF